MENNASILLKALPYIQRFYGKILVIKIGGALVEEKKVRNKTLKDLVLLNFLGMKPVVVHGGGSKVSKRMKKKGKEPKFIEGLRVTDEETIEIIHRLLGGKINKEIVLGLKKEGGLALGITGIDGNLIQAKKIKSKKEDLGFVGEIEKINPKIIKYLINESYIPVIASIGADEKGLSLNLNADTVAAELASSLKAEKLILITDVPGVLSDTGDDSSTIPTLKLGEAQNLIENGVVTEGMIPKIKACLKGIENGVNYAHIINGEIPHAILLELLTERETGTVIEGDKHGSN